MIINKVYSNMNLSETFMVIVMLNKQAASLATKYSSSEQQHSLLPIKNQQTKRKVFTEEARLVGLARATPRWISVQILWLSVKIF